MEEMLPSADSGYGLLRRRGPFFCKAIAQHRKKERKKRGKKNIELS